MQAMLLLPGAVVPPLARLPKILTTSAPTIIITSSLLRRRNTPPSLAGFHAPHSPLSSDRPAPSLQPCGLSKRAVPASAPPSAPAFPSPDEESERAELAQVTKRLEETSRSFKRLGSLGFWGQLVCTVVAAVVLSFSAVVTGKITSPATFYAASSGIVAAFVSVFWSFGYIRLSEKLRRTASDPAKAPPRAEVVKSLKNGIVVNLLGMGATVLGMQATVGFLVAKSLTSSVIPYYQRISTGPGPVLALDVFLVQALANTILSHFVGLTVSLELLRLVTLPHLDAVPAPKAA